MTPSIRSAVLALPLLFACGPQVTNEDPGDEVQYSAEELTSIERGSKFFHTEKFNGNGRTCATCHSDGTGTVSPADAQRRFAANPADPLFRSIDSDNGTGSQYSRLLQHATIRVELPLPPNVRLRDSNARTVVVNRGIPSTIDTPALDPVLMLDGRQPTLTAQALGAINGHYQPRTQPTSDQLNDIANYEKSLFSSTALRSYARGGAAPGLPAGSTLSERRGRAFFDGPTSLCGQCHGGALLNESDGFHYGRIGVSEFNFMNNPVYAFLVTNPDGSTVEIDLSDPGRGLITGRAEDFGFFKMVSLRNIKNTAPYFHDNSAKTLNDVLTQYDAFFSVTGMGRLSPQDKTDLINFMKLL